MEWLSQFPDFKILKGIPVKRSRPKSLLHNPDDKLQEMSYRCGFQQGFLHQILSHACCLLNSGSRSCRTGAPVVFCLTVVEMTKTMGHYGSRGGLSLCKDRNWSESEESSLFGQGCVDKQGLWLQFTLLSLCKIKQERDILLKRQYIYYICNIIEKRRKKQYRNSLETMQ